MNEFTQKAIDLILSIPAGKVMTYGQIARMAGSPRGARQVVRILHSMSVKYGLPWHRVINVKGEISIASDEGSWTQIQRLRAEGVEVTGNKVQLERYQYHPLKIEE
ncbi:MGMT family protein [Peribacillus kribbensis]|uniref:MGMT family protein n=1 Tax=Peribacillus kribbensis TaxID=356658 RepID=UPI000406E670|nr:MGMT family protein [Peribacillus kribbensis]